VGTSALTCTFTTAGSIARSHTSSQLTT